MKPDLSIPAALYGRFSEVKSRVSRALRKLDDSTDLGEALDPASMLQVASTPGLIVLNGPAPLLATEEHFHVFLPLALVLERVRQGKLDENRKRQVISASLESPWGLLGILAPKNQAVVYPRDLHAAILERAARWWDVLDSPGARYTVGLRSGATLWDVTTNLHYVLGQSGVSEERLEERLPHGGLRSIIPTPPETN